MGRRGPQPKHPDSRQRRNREHTGLTVVDGSGLAEPPEPPAGWFKVTRESWDRFWRSDLARTVEPTDVPALERLWHLRDQWERARRIVTKEPLVTGSQGQPVENPLSKRMDRIASEIRQLEDRFGLSPSGRARLNVSFGDAVRSIDDISRRFAADDDDSFQVIDTAAVEDA